MATKVMLKKKESVESEEPTIEPKAGQSRLALGRFRLQVDRQTKSAFDSADEATKIGQAIKKAHPVVQVSIYDAVESTQTILK
jgi:hypothetical protein